MPTKETAVLQRQLERERAARKQAETLLEEKSRELYQTNQELRSLADHLEELVQERTKELAHARDQALEANRAKSVFLANMSHELRTPLNAILGFTQLMMRDHGLSAEYHENLDVIIRSGEHLLGLINDVLEMSKIEAGQHILNAENFDLYYMLNGLEDMFRLRASDKKLTLLFDLAEEVPQYIRTDPNKLRQVLFIFKTCIWSLSPTAPHRQPSSCAKATVRTVKSKRAPWPTLYIDPLPSSKPCAVSSTVTRSWLPKTPWRLAVGSTFPGKASVMRRTLADFPSQ